jgi:formylglycine-generating enzyme required for sulfatase activity
MMGSPAEWEHACRAGTTTPFSFGENITPEQVNYDGNVCEWSADAWQKKLGKAVVVDPYCQSDDKVARRVLRGGSWSNYCRYVRSAYRFYLIPDDNDRHFGFRRSSESCTNRW